jgi:hypothetical protein
MHRIRRSLPVCLPCVLLLLGDLTARAGELATTKNAAIGSRQPALSSEMALLREKARKTLAVYRSRMLNTRDNTPWEVLHAAIAFGCDTKMRWASPAGQEVNAIGMLCWNVPMSGYQLFSQAGDGTVAAEVGYAVQGHPGQFLGVLAQSHVPIEYPMLVNGRNYTVADLVENEKRTCRSGIELTFKLIGLSHYLKSDTVWRSASGETWSLSRLIREELQEPINGATCGGTHRLFGLSFAVERRKHRNEPIDGEFWRANKYVEDFQRYAMSLQNDDGSFSTDFFAGRSASPDPERRLWSTGHTLEWLAFSLPADQLDDPMMTKGIGYLSEFLVEGNHPRFGFTGVRTEVVGSVHHALHALLIYDRRVWKGSAAGASGQAKPQANDATPSRPSGVRPTVLGPIKL